MIAAMSSTVRLSQSLSDRLTERARAKGSTPEELLDEMLRREELLAGATADGRGCGESGTSMADATPSQLADYYEETRIWQQAVGDGLEPEEFPEWNETPAS